MWARALTGVSSAAGRDGQRLSSGAVFLGVKEGVGAAALQSPSEKLELMSCAQFRAVLGPR